MGGCCGKGGPLPLDPSALAASAVAGPDAAELAQLAADHAAQEAAQEAAQRARDEKARQRRMEQEQRAAAAQQLAEAKLAEELALADELENGGDRAASDADSELSDDDDDGPEFWQGHRVKLRDPDRGKMRRTKINLNSGYDVAKVKRLVEADMEWAEPEQSGRCPCIRAPVPACLPQHVPLSRPASVRSVTRVVLRVAGAQTTRPRRPRHLRFQ